MIAVGFVLLAAGGALARWQFTRLNTIAWPGGTLTVNVGAAFVLGLLSNSSASTMTLAGTALLGSYSTFSTIMREVTDLTGSEGLQRAATYLGVTLVAGIGAALVGLEFAAQ